MADFDHIWQWHKRPVRFDGQRFIPLNRKGQRCRVVARGALNSILVEFEDGWRCITSRYAVREAPVSAAPVRGQMSLF